MYNTSTLKVQIDMKGESMFTDIIAIMPEQVKGKGIYSRIYKEDESISVSYTHLTLPTN